MLKVRRRLSRAGVCVATTGAALALALPLTSAAAPDRSAGPGPVPASHQAVTIKRDSYGVPHVYAGTTRNLFRGYGYVVAEDRLFQMEMSRRATQGTVAEVLGASFLPFDKDTRSGFNPASIQAQIDALQPGDRDILAGYAAGMNEYIDRVEANPDELMPKQFLDYGFRPSRWTAYDVAMVWVGTMANRYSDSTAEVPNYTVLQELTAAYGAKRGRALFDQLLWLEDPDAPTTVPRRDRRTRLPASGQDKLEPLAPGVRDVGVESMKRAGGGTWPQVAPTASNLWITGKERTTGANSVLVNGPQFQWFNPSYVFGIGLHGAGYDFAGNTPFAYPSVIFGTNNTIAWGATAGPMNVVDVYQEQLHPTDPRRYLYQGKYPRMTVRTETIKVKGGADVRHQVLATVHGFVTSTDEKNRTAYSKKRSWSGLEIQSLLAWVKMSKAQNWKEFSAQAAKFAITINWYYSDKHGNIGYISPGRLPRRPVNQDVRLPALGDGSMEWEGFEPSRTNPTIYNPRQGYIANWNNQSAAGFNNDYGNWSAVDRVNEITAAFEGRSRPFTPEQVWELNERFSFADLNLRYLAPTLRAAARRLPAGDPVRRDIALITRWDGQTRDADDDGSYDGPQPAIMRTWLPILFERVLADDLPASVYSRYVTNIYQLPVDQRSIQPARAMKLINNGILGRRSGVPQTVDFFDGERPRDVVVETYREALAKLRADRGTDLTAWTVPTSRLEFSYRNFLGIPQANPDETLAGPEYMNRGTENILAVLGRGRPRLCLAAPPGQSGFVSPTGRRSPHYADQMKLYAEFNCRDEHLTRRSVDQNTESVTVLR